MKKATLTALMASIVFSTSALAQKAEEKIAVYDCSTTEKSVHATVRGSSLNGGTDWDSKNTEDGLFSSTQETRKNLSTDSCLEQDLSSWMTSLKNNCPTYFATKSITPLNRGYGEYLYKDEYNEAEGDHSGGYGYSYTDRLVMIYYCL